MARTWRCSSLPRADSCRSGAGGLLAASPLLAARTRARRGWQALPRMKLIHVPSCRPVCVPSARVNHRGGRRAAGGGRRATAGGAGETGHTAVLGHAGTPHARGALLRGATASGCGGGGGERPRLANLPRPPLRHCLPPCKRPRRLEAHGAARCQLMPVAAPSSLAAFPHLPGSLCTAFGIASCRGHGIRGGKRSWRRGRFFKKIQRGELSRGRARFDSRFKLLSAPRSL